MSAAWSSSGLAASARLSDHVEGTLHGGDRISEVVGELRGEPALVREAICVRALGDEIDEHGAADHADERDDEEQAREEQPPLGLEAGDEEQERHPEEAPDGDHEAQRAGPRRALEEAVA